MDETLDTVEAGMQRSRVTVEHDPRVLAEARARELATRLGPGDVLGRYELLRELGRGGAAVVHAARDTERHHEIALKIIHASACASERAALEREAQALAKIQHPNVVTVEEVGTTPEGRMFLAMELVEGHNLRAWIEAGPSLAAIRDVFGQAGQGLLAVHEAGLVHGDFKPENVMVEGERVLVLDLGLAQPEPERSAETSATGGTRIYMAPELLWRLSEPSPRSDQFSFCVALWEALYGERPFERRDLHAGPPKAPTRGGGRRVPGVLRDALTRGLALDPEDRFATLEPLLAALARRWAL